MAWTVLRREPRCLGPYEILAKLGKGAAGTVFKARHRQTGALVALKILCRGEARNPLSVKRFEQEFFATRALDDPHIVRGLDYGCEGTTPYLVMEFVEGESLSAHLKARGRLAEHEAISIAVQVAQALHVAHQRGMIHRDVKPGNIMLAADGRTRLTDFGLVKCLESVQNLTATAMSLGTSYFMAPDQFDDCKRVDLRCDAYGLAATLYTAVTGQLPFQAGGFLSLVRKKLDGELIAPRDIVPELSVRTDWAIRRGLSVSPVMRQASCVDFVRDLTGAELQIVKTYRQTPLKVKAEPGKEVKTGQDDRRADFRHACRLSSVCGPVGGKGQKPWVAEVLDISSGGLALVLQRRFEPGTVLAVDLRRIKEEVPASLMARVVRAQAHGSGQWVLGCQLGRRLGDEDLRALL